MQNMWSTIMDPGVCSKRPGGGAGMGQTVPHSLAQTLARIATAGRSRRGPWPTHDLATHTPRRQTTDQCWGAGVKKGILLVREGRRDPCSHALRVSFGLSFPHAGWAANLSPLPIACTASREHPHGTHAARTDPRLLRCSQRFRGNVPGSTLDVRNFGNVDLANLDM